MLSLERQKRMLGCGTDSCMAELGGALGVGRLVTGDVPGLDLIVYGAVLVLVIWFTPRGLIGGFTQVRKWLTRRGTPAASYIQEEGRG